MVITVDDDGPAALAGMRAGDVITRFDGEGIRSVEDLLTTLRGTEPGEVVPLVVMRDGDRQELSVDIGTRTS